MGICWTKDDAACVRIACCNFGGGGGGGTGTEAPFGVYGLGLNDAAAGVKKGRSEVDVKRRFRARVAFVDDVPVNESEVLRVGRVSDMAGDC